MTTPAERVIEICGGIKAVAEMVGRSEMPVRRWTYPKERGGTGGVVPAGVQQALLTEARARGIDLRPEHFFADPLPAPGSDDQKQQRGAA